MNRRLTGRQRMVLDLIRLYWRVTGEPCAASYLARRLNLHHSTLQEHLFALYQKGLLEGPTSPARPTLRVSDPAMSAAPQRLRGSE